MAGKKRYKTVKGMQKDIDAYFSRQSKRKKPLTIQGLALALGFSSRTSLINYEGYNDEEEKPFLNTIKRAKLMIEENKVEGMLTGDYSTAGSIFDLINNHKHKQSSNIDHTTQGEQISISPIQWIDAKDK